LDVLRLSYQVIEFRRGGQFIAVPLQAASRAQHYAHKMPAARDSMAESMQPSLRLDQCRWCGGKHHSRGTQRQSDNARLYRTNPHSLSSLIATPSYHRSPLCQSGLHRRLAADQANLVQVGEPFR
jgi:hypothetical protein